MAEITPEAIYIKNYIQKHWNHLFTVRLEVPLKELFDEPGKGGCHHIWKHGTADIAVYDRSTNRLVAIIEPGGAHHYEDKQMQNDKRKYKLCEINKVGCLHLMNSVVHANLINLSNRKFRSMIGSVLFKKWS